MQYIILFNVTIDNLFFMSHFFFRQDALLLVLLYPMYLILMALNPYIEKGVYRCMGDVKSLEKRFGSSKKVVDNCAKETDPLISDNIEDAVTDSLRAAGNVF